MTRLEEWAQRVAEGILLEADGRRWSVQKREAAAVLAREVRAFVTELCGNRDAFLDASSPVQQGEPPRCKPWCGTTAKAPIPDGASWRLDSIGATTVYCTPACRDAGRALHPPQPSEER